MTAVSEDVLGLVDTFVQLAAGKEILLPAIVHDAGLLQCLGIIHGIVPRFELRGRVTNGWDLDIWMEAFRAAMRANKTKQHGTVIASGREPDVERHTVVFSSQLSNGTSRAETELLRTNVPRVFGQGTWHLRCEHGGWTIPRNVWVQAWEAVG
jgi:hypothetical protein